MKIKPTSAEARFFPFLESQTKDYQEERAYLTLAENLVAEMNYYKTNGYQTHNYTSTIRFWNYESDKENEEVLEKVLFTPFDFWANWNPKLAEGDN
jgi:hypothetical protein